MPRTKLLIAASSALAALSIAVPSCATAEWFVNGAKLTTTAAVATTASVDTGVTLNSPSLHLTIKCSGATLELHVHEIFPNGALRYIAHAWLGCSVVQPTSCSIPSEITSNAVTGTTTTGTSPEDRLTQKPTSGRLLAAITFEGATCPFLGEEPLDGSFTEKLPTGQNESVIQAVESLGSTENNSLELAGAKAYFEGGKALLKLASGSKWSFH